MPPPPESTILKALQTTRNSLISFDPDTANDPKSLREKLLDNHVGWNGVTLEQVTRLLGELKAGDKKTYVPPAELYDMDLMFIKGTPREELPDSWEKLDIVGIHHAQGGVGSKGCYVLATLDSPPRQQNMGRYTTPPSLLVIKEASPDFIGEVFASSVFRAAERSAPKLTYVPETNFANIVKRMETEGTRITVGGTWVTRMNVCLPRRLTPRTSDATRCTKKPRTTRVEA